MYLSLKLTQQNYFRSYQYLCFAYFFQFEKIGFFSPGVSKKNANLELNFPLYSMKDQTKIIT